MRYILFSLLFFLPFLIVPFGNSQFEIPKVIIGEILIELLLFIFLAKHSPKQFSEKENLPIFGLFLLSLFHLLFLRTDITLFGNSFRLQGVFLLWHLLILFLLAKNITLPKISSWVILAFPGVQTAAAFFIGTPITGRAIGTLGEPNALAAYSIFIWPFVLNTNQSNTKQRIILIVIALLFTSCIIFLSGSRSGMLALSIQTLFLILSYIKKTPYKTSVLVTCVLFLVSLSTPFLTPQNPYENRVEVWKIAFLGGFERPIFGGGFGNLEKNFDTSAERIDLPIQYYYVDSSHNVFLDYWFQGGIIGLCLFLFLVIQTLKNFIKQKNTVGIILFLGLLTVLSFNPASIVILIAFWWLMGYSYHAHDRHTYSSA